MHPDLMCTRLHTWQVEPWLEDMLHIYDDVFTAVSAHHTARVALINLHLSKAACSANRAVITGGL